MKRLTTLCLVILTAVFSFGGYKTEIIKDKFEGYTKIRMKDNKLGALSGESCRKAISLYAQNHNGTFVEFIAQKYIGKSGEESYQIFFDYHGEDWLFLDGNVNWIIDAKKYDFQNGEKLDSETYKQTIAGVDTYCHETIFFETDRKFLQEISNASMVEVKLTGSKYYVIKCFGKNNFDNLKIYLDDTK